MRGETKKVKGKAPVLLPIVEALNRAKWGKSVSYLRPTGKPIDTVRRCLSAAFEGYPIWIKVSCNDAVKTWKLTWDWGKGQRI